MKVVLRGDSRGGMWRIILTKDGVFHLQKKGFRGRRWNDVGVTKGEDSKAIRRLTKGVTANWY